MKVKSGKRRTTNGWKGTGKGVPKGDEGKRVQKNQKTSKTFVKAIYDRRAETFGESRRD